MAGPTAVTHFLASFCSCPCEHPSSTLPSACRSSLAFFPRACRAQLQWCDARCCRPASAQLPTLQGLPTAGVTHTQPPPALRPTAPVPQCPRRRCPSSFCPIFGYSLHPKRGSHDLTSDPKGLVVRRSSGCVGSRLSRWRAGLVRRACSTWSAVSSRAQGPVVPPILSITPSPFPARCPKMTIPRPSPPQTRERGKLPPRAPTHPASPPSLRC